MRFASIRQIGIIREAANLITQDTRDKFTGINWRQIVGMRHMLVHEYFGIDNNLIWQVIIDDIPKFRLEVQRIITLVDDEM